MATVKLATLLIRVSLFLHNATYLDADNPHGETVAKPISAQLKNQAKQHERFRTVCVDLAQRMYRAEVKLRTNILGEPAKHIRPLSETKAIENGANALAEGFLFTVAAAIIIGETWRTSRNQSKRRDNIDDQLDDLGTKLAELTTRMDVAARDWETRLDEEKQRNDELARILERVVEIGLRGGWAEFEDTPLALPRIQLGPHLLSSEPSPPPESDLTNVSVSETRPNLESESELESEPEPTSNPTSSSQ